MCYNQIIDKNIHEVYECLKKNLELRITPIPTFPFEGRRQDTMLAKTFLQQEEINRKERII